MQRSTRSSHEGYEIRAVLPSDADDITGLARHLDSMNLPHERSAIDKLLELSAASFAGEVEAARAVYVFAVRDLARGHLVATSMIVGQLGDAEAPYVYFEVKERALRSPRLGHHESFPVLSLAWSYEGPTEIGGLVVDPSMRRSPARVGTLISYVRFLWMAMRPQLFRERIVAELMGPLHGDRSPLWDTLGQPCTGLSYREADRLSKHDKSFILDLFPRGEIDTRLLPREAREVIAQVGDQSRGVEKLLRRIGFHFADRIDPFDGGPHFEAQRTEVSLIKHAWEAKVELDSRPSGKQLMLIARAYPKEPWFRALALPARRSHREEKVWLSAESAAQLGVEAGDYVGTLPLWRGSRS